MMDDPFILQATLQTLGPELHMLGGPQVKLSLYVLYGDGSDRRITLFGDDLPSLIRAVRAVDLSRESEAAHG